MLKSNQEGDSRANWASVKCITPDCTQHTAHCSCVRGTALAGNTMIYLWSPNQDYRVCITVHLGAGDAKHIAWAAQGGEILDLYGDAHYINMNRFDSQGSIESCYPPENWARLQELKAQYDPHQLYRQLDYYRTDDGFGNQAADADPSNNA